MARYADTGGFECDLPLAGAWKYRDWVIRSFNEDKPLDRPGIRGVDAERLGLKILADGDKQRIDQPFGRHSRPALAMSLPVVGVQDPPVESFQVVAAFDEIGTQKMKPFRMRCGGTVVPLIDRFDQPRPEAAFPDSIDVTQARLRGSCRVQIARILRPREVENYISISNRWRFSRARND